MTIYVTKGIYAAFLKSAEFLQIDPGEVGVYQGVRIEVSE